MGVATTDAREPGAQAVCVYGKTVAHGDFVRIRANGEAGQRLQRFLLETVERLSLANASLPDEPICFVVATARGARVAVGALRPSRDSVGRSFPLCVFAELDPSAFAGRVALLSVAASRFMARASELLDAGRSMDARTLEAHLASFEGPSASDVEAASRLCDEALAGAPARDFLERGFGDLGPAAAGSGIGALLGAARAARSGRSTELLVDCPVAIDLDVFAWLEIAERLVGGVAPVACAWTEVTPRLQIALGPARSSLLVALAGAAGNDPGLVHLRRAVEAPAVHFSLDLARALEGDGTLGDLVDWIAAEGASS